MNNDISIVPDRLSLIRSYPSQFTLRSTESKSVFCLGWQDNLHMSVEIESSLGILILTVSGVEHVLYESSEVGVYDSSEYQVISNELDSTDFVLITSKLYEIVYVYHMREKCIRQIELATSDGERRELVLKVTCNRNGQITEIVSEDNSISLRFSYSQSNCLTAVNKYTRDDGGRIELVVYAYDNKKRLLSAVGTGFKQSMSYDLFNNLNEINEENMFTYYFQYDSENGIHLRRMSLFDESLKMSTLDNVFEYVEDGFTYVYDHIKGIHTRILYDLNGRLIYTNQNDFNVKLTGNIESQKSTILQNEEVIKFSYNFNL